MQKLLRWTVFIRWLVTIKKRLGNIEETNLGTNFFGDTHDIFLCKLKEEKKLTQFSVVVSQRGCVN